MPGAVGQADEAPGIRLQGSLLLHLLPLASVFRQRLEWTMLLSHFMETLNGPMMKTGEHAWLTAKRDRQKLKMPLKSFMFPI